MNRGLRPLPLGRCATGEAIHPKCGSVPEMPQVLKRLVYICDWLPPDFGAVGQYAMLEVRDWAKRGYAVTLVGLTTGEASRGAAEQVGEGSVEIVRVHRPSYQKHRFIDRLIWTVASNLILLRAAFGRMRTADTVLFTGSPPLLLHFIAPLNLLLRRRLVYRIMDFHPECLIAERGGGSLLLRALLSLTCFWRRRVDRFEVLGADQAQRLRDIGIPHDRIEIKPNASPVAFPTGLKPLPLPPELQGATGVILYSGNWGVAHDEDTFIEGYARYVARSARPLRFWINATGAKADRVEQEFHAREVPVHRSRLVPLEGLPRLLITADIHLVTLRDPFVGYVLPSKIHAAIDSGKRVLFVGSPRSDVHRLAAAALPEGRYHRVDVGDVEGLVRILHHLEIEVASAHKQEDAAGGGRAAAIGSGVWQARTAAARGSPL
jgi:Glycosyl transferase 4-like domain